jgi:hypothetical protein
MLPAVMTDDKLQMDHLTVEQGRAPSLQAKDADENLLSELLTKQTG